MRDEAEDLLGGPHARADILDRELLARGSRVRSCHNREVGACARVGSHSGQAVLGSSTSVRAREANDTKEEVSEHRHAVHREVDLPKTAREPRQAS